MPTTRDRAPRAGRARAVVTVGAGGAAGTAARLGVDALLGTPGGWPLGTLAVNVLGALLLGALLARSPRPALRLLAATGFLGAFTTYSALAVETVALAGEGSAVRGLAYAGGSLALGLLACVAGAALAAPRSPDARLRSGSRGVP